MRKFKDIRTLDEIHAQCLDQGVPFDDSDYILGGDTVLVGREGDGHVVFNTFNGSFTGVTPEGMPFRYDSDEYEDHDWFIALLGFFYK